MHKNMELQQKLFNFSFVILTIKNMLDSTNLFNRPEILDNIFLVVFFACILWKLSLQTYRLWMLPIFLILGLICIYTCMQVKYYYLIFSFVGIIAMQDVKLKEVIKYTAFTKTLLLCIHVFVYGVIFVLSPENIHLIVRNGVARHYFLLGHPNTFSMYVLWNTFEYLYVYYEKIKKRHLLLLWSVNITFYLFTNSNTSFLVSTFTYFLVLLDKLEWKRFQHVLRLVSRNIFIWFALFFCGVSVFYTRFNGKLLEFYHILNEALTGRLLYGAYTYDVYGLTLFGRIITFPVKSYWRGFWFDTMVFDNSYIWLFTIYGSVYLIFIGLSLRWVGKYTIKEEMLLIIAYCLYGVMESYIINAAICFPLLIIGKYLYDTNKKRMVGQHD